MSDAPKVLSVGQCGLDGPRIKNHLTSSFGASVDAAGSVEEAEEMIAGGSYRLVLVNRILDATHEEGLAVVKAAAEHGTPVMLVSNYDDAQEAAVAAGAKKGFGKAKLTDSSTTSLLREALEDESA